MLLHKSTSGWTQILRAGLLLGLLLVGALPGRTAWGQVTSSPLHRLGYGRISSAAFTSGGGQAVTGSYDGLVRVWDFKSKKVAHTLAGHQNLVRAVAFSPGGQQVLSGSADWSARLWDAKTGNQLLQLPADKKTKIGEVWAVAFSTTTTQSGSRILLTGSTDRTIRLWDSVSGQPVMPALKATTGTITAVAMSPDGSHVAAVTRDYHVWIWTLDLATSTSSLKEITGQPINVMTTLAFTRDGKKLLTGGYDLSNGVLTPRVWLWDLSSDSLVRTYTPGVNGNLVTSLAVSSNGGSFAVGCTDRTAKIINIGSGRTTNTFAGYAAGVTGVGVTSDGKRLMTTSDDQSIVSWDIASATVSAVMLGHSRELFLAGFQPDGKQVLTVSADGYFMRWSATSGNSKGMALKSPYGIRAADLSRDGQKVLVPCINSAFSWDLKHAVVEKVMNGHKAAVETAVFSPDRKKALTGSDDTTAIIWDVKKEKALKKLKGHSGPVTAVAYAHNGKQVLTGSRDFSVRLWNASSGNRLLTLTDPTITTGSAVVAVAFSADDKQILVGCEDGRVRVWDAASGQFARYYDFGSKNLSTIAVSNQGRYLLGGFINGQVRVIDLQTEQQELYLGNYLKIAQAEFASDDNSFVTASSDGSAIIWRVTQPQAASKVWNGHL